MPSPEIPTFLPHGWKKEVALILGIHPNTVSRALHSRQGITYRKILKAVADKYGEKKNPTNMQQKKS